MYVKGLEFKVFSTSNNTTSNSRHDSFAFPNTFFEHLLTLPTNLPKFPPHHKAHSKLNSQLICLPARKSCICRCSCIFLRPFAVDLNVLALSEIIKFGIPLLAQNFLSTCMKLKAVRSWISSRFTALVIQQENKTM